MNTNSLKYPILRKIVTFSRPKTNQSFKNLHHKKLNITTAKPNANHRYQDITTNIPEKNNKVSHEL